MSNLRIVLSPLPDYSLLSSDINNDVTILVCPEYVFKQPPETVSHCRIVQS